MSPQRPLWRRGFDRLERVIGEPLELAVHSDAFFDSIAAGRRAQEALARRAEALSRRSLHLLGIPARSDVRHLREQLAYVERQLREISRQLEGPPPRSEGKSAPRTGEREPAKAPRRTPGADSPWR